MIIDESSYDCYVKRRHVQDALQYKIKYDLYYHDVVFSMENLAWLPKEKTNISSMLHIVNVEEDTVVVASKIRGDEDSDDTIPTQTSKMVPKLPSRQHELDIIKWVLDIDDSIEDILD